MPASVSASEADRRQLTVLFCDLVGSTYIADQLDPEDLSELIRTYRTACATVIERFDGFVARHVGDGILAYFGYPRAHEDDAERAVLAALDIIETLGRLHPEKRWGPAIDLAVRIGVATGLVVAGDLAREGSGEKKLAVGQAPNLAARLQSLARRNQIVIADSTWQLLGGMFGYADMGHYRLKGFAESVRVWRVIGRKRVESRFEAIHALNLTPLVNREAEIDLLLHLWHEAGTGAGQVVMLSGEPGIGKSRVIQALRERIADQDHAEEYYQCSSYYSNSALYPIIDQFESLAGFTREDSSEQRLAKLEAMLEHAGAPLEKAMPLFADMLSIPVGDRYPALGLSPQKQKEKTFDAMFQHLVHLSAGRPLLLLFEDIHWADPTTLEMLGLVLERAQELRMLMVCTCRPVFQPPWVGQARLLRLNLERLSAEHSLGIMQRVTRGKSLPRKVVEQILAKTEGIPLYVEELTKALLETRAFSESEALFSDRDLALTIPASLQDSLMARLDQLAPAKTVAQIGSVIGREFSHELLAAVARLPEPKLQAALTQLIESGLIYRHGASSQGAYAFKHALIQDAAYDSLLRTKRRLLHARIADVIETQFPQKAASNPEILAHHYAVADFPDKAVDYYLKAGIRASDRSANVEASEHLRKGLTLLQRLPNTSVHRQQKLSLLLALGATLINAKGPGTPEVRETYRQAQELSTTLPNTPQQFTAYWGFWRACYDLQVAREIADKLQSIAANQARADLHLQAHHAQWATLFNLGQLAACQDHIEAGLAVYDPQEHASHATLYGGHDARVCAQGEAALMLWLQGFPERACSRAKAALAWAMELDHPASLAHAFDYELMLRYYRREASAILSQVRAVIAFAEEKRLPHYRARALALQGWALAAQGQRPAGVDLLLRGLKAQRDTGVEDDFPIFLDMLAQSCCDERHAGQGLEAIAEAFALAERSSMRHWRAELHRRKGQLLLFQGNADPAAVKICFTEALELAQAQKAKSLELRAATSLAHWRLEQGDPDAVRTLLAPVYAWFCEGFDTVDLGEARELLEAVSC